MTAIGKRIKDLTGSQDYFSPELVILVDKIDTGSGDWLLSRKMPIGLLGNTRIQGSTNTISWHDDITSSDLYLRISTDNGVTWRNLNTDLIREGSNLYFTEDKVLAVAGVQDAVDNAHTHSNKDILDNIVDSGDGKAFLSNDGTYRQYSTQNIAIKTSAYTVTTSDDIILVNTSSGSVTITLPDASTYENESIVIKCIDGTNICSINPNGGYIDNSTDIITINEMESVTMVSYDNKWWII